MVSIYLSFHPIPIPISIPITSPQRLPRKNRQHETSAVNLPTIIPTQLLLLLDTPTADRGLEIALGILAADHKPDLAGRIGRDGRVGVLDGREDFLAGFFEGGDHGEVEPLVLGCVGRGGC